MTPSTPSVKRDIFLIISPNPLFAAHWSIWIPSIPQAEGEDLGKVLHVTGSPVTGFVHEVKRGYDMSTTRHAYSFIILGQIDSNLVVDVDLKDQVIFTADDDCEAPSIESIDAIEKLAFSVPAPKKTLKSASDNVNAPRPKIENCQNWIGHFVDLLVDEGILDANARTLLESAPKH
ncbi:hypothetical protein C0989_012168 [Termitomyces sp. Mn162]|nr:hypothetical protein C0989_012168 [Termitomyces sp. Mn162]